MSVWVYIPNIIHPQVLSEYMLFSQDIVAMSQKIQVAESDDLFCKTDACVTFYCSLQSLLSAILMIIIFGRSQKHHKNDLCSSWNN